MTIDPVPVPVANGRPLEYAGDRLLTAGELADHWQVPKAQVYRLTREGRIPAVRLGRYYRYARTAIASFEAAGGVPADG